MLDPDFKRVLTAGQGSWREVVALAVRHGIRVPAFGSALSYFDGYRSARLPANLLQAQRDYSAPTPTSAWMRRAGSSSTWIRQTRSVHKLAV